MDFVDIYKEHKGPLRKKTIDEINEGLSDMITDTEMYVWEQGAHAEGCEDTAGYNDRVLKREGFSREDWEKGELPAYVESHLYDESKSKEDYLDNIRNAYDDLYEAAYQVDPVISDDNRKGLGDGYAEYKNAKDAEIESKRMSRMMNCENAKNLGYGSDGSTFLNIGVADSKGVIKDDGYSFDEFG